MFDSGIYIVTNNIDQRVYVGSTNNFIKRRKHHISLLKNNKHVNPHLQRFVNKYGIESLKFQTLEYIEDEQTRLDKEQYWIDHYKQTASLFNVSLNVLAPMTGRKFTEESKLKMSIAHIGQGLGSKKTPEQRSRMGHAGFSPSSETRLKLSIAHKGQKLSDYQIKRLSKPVFQFSMDGKLLAEFPSAKTAERLFKVKNISTCCLGKLGSVGGFKWVYKEDYNVL